MICRICGKSFADTAYMSPYDTICGSSCFETNFWREAVAEYNNDTKHKIVSDGNDLYFIGNENDKSSFRGFGGAKVKIIFYDGTIVYSTNLWHRGKIPMGFKSKLLANATLQW